VRLSHLFRPLTRSEAGQRAAGWLIARYLRLVHRTGRWRFIGLERRGRDRLDNEACLVLSWHNRLALLPFIWDTDARPLTVLTSSHRDGQLVSRVCASFGIASIAVNSSAADTQAARAVARALRAGSFIGVAPDGPRGPRLRINETVLPLARFAGGRIALVTYAARRRIVLRSWDRFHLPLPFTRGVFLFTPGVRLAADMDEAEAEKARRRVERALRRLTDLADRMVGNAPTEPPTPDEVLKAERKNRARAAEGARA
jgi:lysophospholipid acyltransferase (LPLAT)-like uncharacterized protein